jgi:protein-L-isoaspartate(D-aspartate) O-methyltransferase
VTAAGASGAAGERHAALLSALEAAEVAPAAVLEAFAEVPRHLFLPGVGPEEAYSDDAIVTAMENGVPTSSSSQPSLMARMLAMLDLRPGQRVLEVGAGTGYNAALMAALGARVTTVELQAAVATAAREHLAEAGLDEVVDVVTGDGAEPPPGPFDRIIVTAGLWTLPPALIAALAGDGLLVAPLRINGVELVMALRKQGAALSAAGGLPCGFMPLQGAEERPWRWALGGGGTATADADLGVEGRGALDRLLASDGREVADPLALRAGERVLEALLWLGLQGDPLITLVRPREGGRRPRWTVALDVLPASLLVLDLGAANDRVATATLYGGDGALRTCAAAMAAWRAAGSPGPAALALSIEPHDGRSGWTLPYRDAGGVATMVRGAHRWRLAYA